jgi:hypothetical protein
MAQGRRTTAAAQQERPVEETATSWSQARDILDGLVCAAAAAGSAAGLPPVMVWGPPGVGKSALVREVARAHRLDLVDIRLTQRETVDVRGLPVPEGDRVRWLVSEEYPRDPASRGILFLDELPSADPSVQVAAYELILDRRLGTAWTLPAGWLVVAAGNRAEDASVFRGMPAALANRLLHLELGVEPRAWLTWARSAGLDEDVIAFLESDPRRLLQFPAGRQERERGWPSPRSWERVSQVLGALRGRPLPVVRAALAGLIGPGTAATLVGWLDARRVLPSGEDALWGRAELTWGQRPDLDHAQCRALALAAAGAPEPPHAVAERLLTLMPSLPAPWGTLLARQVLEAGSPELLQRLLEDTRWQTWLRDAMHRCSDANVHPEVA